MINNNNNNDYALGSHDYSLVWQTLCKLEKIIANSIGAALAQGTTMLTHWQQTNLSKWEETFLGNVHTDTEKWPGWSHVMESSMVLGSIPEAFYVYCINNSNLLALAQNTQGGVMGWCYCGDTLRQVTRLSGVKIRTCSLPALRHFRVRRDSDILVQPVDFVHSHVTNIRKEGVVAQNRPSCVWLVTFDTRDRGNPISRKLSIARERDCDIRGQRCLLVQNHVTVF